VVCSDLIDPRIVLLVRQAIAYRHVEGAVVELGGRPTVG
jgi:hypothetical protein